METKESVYVKEEFNSHRIYLEHQNGRRFIVFEHQNGRRDVMWKRSIDQHDGLSRGYKPRKVYFQTQ